MQVDHDQARERDLGSDREQDRRLAAAVAAGDPEAARRLCETYLPRVHRYVLQRSGLAPDAATDVAQEATVAALRSIQHFRGESSLFTWICGIARRKVADWYRRERRRPLSLDDLVAEGLALMSEGPLPEEIVARDETAQAVHRALWSLPAPQREAVLLKYIEERSVAEIADEFGRSEKAVESLLSRGRATLRRELALLAGKRGAVKGG